MANKTGGNTGGVEYSPGRKRRRAAARRRQEAQWEKKSGPVIESRKEPAAAETDELEQN